ncbi:immunity 53 family protein [Stenotrophomonas sp. C3(2023)]|uniref:immunity 53 family protein n=1 Tax=Stenotrophomonas sp. C3(2023) TaxID=3080277 RepID=UPI00293C3601|nr:immunity 53 family protein [Stenotrophomonas sp. C3(2023)]MDV3469228.1 immunity 53 family protein [Stenotrophomonas sp. C3(2023)]
MDTAIALLQRWYSNHCDGDWEHSYGVKIDTLDNPGWILTVDLIDTELSEYSLPRTRVDRSEIDWIQSEISDGRYIGCGGALNLEEIVLQFLDFAEGCSIGRQDARVPPLGIE